MVEKEKAKLVSMMITVTSLLIVIVVFHDSLQSKSFQLRSGVGMAALYLISYTLLSRRVFSG